MNVAGIFKTLIIVVACVIIGALVLNTLLPNVTTGLINGVEDMLFNATGMSFDFNNDSNAGTKSTGTVDTSKNVTNTTTNAGVAGFKASGK